MNNFIDELISSLDKLYYLYEDYIWKNEDCSLDVLVQDNRIYFYMYKDKNIIDEIIISFDCDEMLIYNYVCIMLLLILFGNVYIYNKDNLIYNDRHKSYLKLIVNDDMLLNNMVKLIDMQDNVIINKDIHMVLDIRKDLEKIRCSNDFIGQLNDRIEFSKKLLRRI